MKTLLERRRLASLGTFAMVLFTLYMRKLVKQNLVNGSAVTYYRDDHDWEICQQGEDK